jgi:hypothetical protein
MTKAAARFGLLAMALAGCDDKTGAMLDSGAHHAASGARPAELRGTES